MWSEGATRPRRWRLLLGKHRRHMKIGKSETARIVSLGWGVSKPEEHQPSSEPIRLHWRTVCSRQKVTSVDGILRQHSQLVGFLFSAVNLCTEFELYVHYELSVVEKRRLVEGNDSFTHFFLKWSGKPLQKSNTWGAIRRFFEYVSCGALVISCNTVSIDII